MRKSGSKVAWDTDGMHASKSSKEIVRGGKANTWESKTWLAARLWAVFNVILFILSIFFLGREGANSPASLSQWFLIPAVSVGVRGVTLQSPLNMGPQKPCGVTVIITACVITSHEPLPAQYVTFCRPHFSFLSFRLRCVSTITVQIKRQTWLTGSIIMKC